MTSRSALVALRDAWQAQLLIEQDRVRRRICEKAVEGLDDKIEDAAP